MTTLNFHQWFNTELVKCKVSKKEFCRYSGFAEKTVLNYCWFKSKPSKKNLNLLCITLAHFQKLNNEQNKGIAMDELREKIFQKGKMSIENMEQQKENQVLVDPVDSQAGFVKDLNIALCRLVIAQTQV